LKIQNEDILEEKFWAVSDPTNPSYAKYLTMKQVAEIISPAKSTVEDILTWLESFGVTNIDIPYMSDYIVAQVPVNIAEALLSTQFFYHQHKSGTQLIRSSGPYYVPLSLSSHIEFVGGVLRFPKMRSVKSYSKPRQDNISTIDPPAIKQLYNIPPKIQGKSSNSSQAVAQFDVYTQYFSPSDLTQFQTMFNLLQQQPTVVGGNVPSNPGDEAMLDIEYIMGVGQNINTWFVTTNGSANGGQEPFLNWIVTLKNTPTAPWVHSVSYGDVESTVSNSYAHKVNQDFQSFGLMGRSILFASGDDGAGCNNAGTQFAPNFPASSPYITAVGGIYLTSTDNFTADGISSGGFSNYFQMVSYQQAAVATYLKSTNLPAASFYNSSGRGYPDVCSFSEDVEIVLDGGATFVAGTSCAAPVWSGVVALLNDARLQSGKSTLGFLNPFLYQTAANHPNAFFDITTGSNYGCISGNGFPAVEGWDAVTGLGSPNFVNLVKYAVAA